jgi:two-component system nitrate/nitrite response regulator NarL
MREAFSVLVVEPNSLFREGLCRILRAAHFRVVNDAPAIDPILLESPGDDGDLLLLLIGAGGDHREAIRQIELFKKKYATGRVAVLSDRNRPSEILAAFTCGANAYFMQSTPCDAFVRSLDLVMRGQTLIPAEILPSFMGPGEGAIQKNVIPDMTAPTHPAPSRPGAPRLSAQESRILQHLIEGHSNKVIARNIDIAEATVKVHIKAILRKIQVHNRTQAAIWAMNNHSLQSGIAAKINGEGGIKIG